jgi:hypothetical protein
MICLESRRVSQSRSLEADLREILRVITFRIMRNEAKGHIPAVHRTKLKGARLEILELLIDHAGVLTREVGRIGAADARGSMTDRALMGERCPRPIDSASAPRTMSERP